MSSLETSFSRRTVTVSIIVVVLLVTALGWLWSGAEEPTSASTDITEALSVDRTGFETASAGTELAFPEDHGPHPGYQLEWWYVTGNVYTESGRRYGYQFTIFRNALAPADSAKRSSDAHDSDWSTRQLYLAHAALSDVNDKTFYADEQLSRGTAGLAGAEAQPFRVWVEDWSIEQEGEALFPWRIRARTDDFSIDVLLHPEKPLVLQGEGGFSPKGPDPGQASIYYSYTRLRTTGVIEVAGRREEVAGLSWLDREWSTSLLGEYQTGWDWFSIQLEDGRDLMAFQLRDRRANVESWKDGLLVGPAGESTRLGAASISLTPEAWWQSQETAARYPIQWRLRVANTDEQIDEPAGGRPGEGDGDRLGNWFGDAAGEPVGALDLRIRATFPAQELPVSVRYWEGSTTIHHAQTDSVLGTGYLEMTGYGTSRAVPGRAK